MTTYTKRNIKQESGYQELERLKNQARPPLLAQASDPQQQQTYREYSTLLDNYLAFMNTTLASLAGNQEAIDQHFIFALRLMHLGISTGTTVVAQMLDSQEIQITSAALFQVDSNFRNSPIDLIFRMQAVTASSATQAASTSAQPLSAHEILERLLAANSDLRQLLINEKENHGQTAVLMRKAHFNPDTVAGAATASAAAPTAQFNEMDSGFVRLTYLVGEPPEKNAEPTIKRQHHEYAYLHRNYPGYRNTPVASLSSADEISQHFAITLRLMHLGIEAVDSVMDELLVLPTLSLSVGKLFETSRDFQDDPITVLFRIGKKAKQEGTDQDRERFNRILNKALQDNPTLLEALTNDQRSNSGPWRLMAEAGFDAASYRPAAEISDCNALLDQALSTYNETCGNDQNAAMQQWLTSVGDIISAFDRSFLAGREVNDEFDSLLNKLVYAYLSAPNAPVTFKTVPSIIRNFLNLGHGRPTMGVNSLLKVIERCAGVNAALLSITNSCHQQSSEPAGTEQKPAGAQGQKLGATDSESAAEEVTTLHQAATSASQLDEDHPAKQAINLAKRSTGNPSQYSMLASTITTLRGLRAFEDDRLQDDLTELLDFSTSVNNPYRVHLVVEMCKAKLTKAKQRFEASTGDNLEATKTQWVTDSAEIIQLIGNGCSGVQFAQRADFTELLTSAVNAFIFGPDANKLDADTVFEALNIGSNYCKIPSKLMEKVQLLAGSAPIYSQVLLTTQPAQKIAASADAAVAASSDSVAATASSTSAGDIVPGSATGYGASYPAPPPTAASVAATAAADGEATIAAAPTGSP